MSRPRGDRRPVGSAAGDDAPVDGSASDTAALGGASYARVSAWGGDAPRACGDEQVSDDDALARDMES